MKRATTGLLALAATFFGFGVLPATAEPAAQVVVKASTRNDVSPPLSTLAGAKGVKPSGAMIELEGGKRSLPVNNKGGGSTGGGGGIASPSSGPQTAGEVQANTPAATVNVQGLANTDNATVHGFSVLPPDTNGDVGPNHYVQAVNLLIRIFDKTGAAVTGPTKMSSLFTGFGGLCESTDRGDPIVQYDPLANRWLLTQFAFGGSIVPAEQCVAVSTTPDPTGTYYRYSFPFGALFNDYGKVGVWPDAYYMSFHLFTSSSVYAGQGAAALDRVKMLTGQPATMILINAGTGVGGMTPSDVVGFTPPAPGAKNFFFDPQDAAFEGGVDRVDMWGFHADFATPANSTFTLDHSIATSAFDGNMCGFSRNCIPQAGTAQGVDALSYRGMNVVAYRNMGTHESWVGNFTVDTGSDHAAPFWYEMRRTGGAPSLFQEGIHTPDTVHRWMGSISMDRAGDIALGYSGSLGSIFPDIRYATRVPGDAAGTLQTEVILQAGGGSQTSSAARWGDYSSMSVDPSDDCTFWYTTEYITATGPAPWTTRIGAFKEPTCTPYTPTASNIGVAITGVPAGSTVGTNFSYTVTIDNAGPSTAPGVSLSHNVGPGMQVVSATPSAGTCGTGAPIGCLLGDIAPGGNVTINMTVKPTAAGVKNMTASVAQLATANDATPANNTANASTTATGGGGGATMRYTTGNVSIPVPPSGTLGTTDVIINVPDAGTILDVNMEIRLNHTFDGDLEFTLFHPDGTATTLVNNRGGSGDNFGSGNADCTGTHTIFNDEAATAISAGTPPFAGSFRPEVALSGLDGKPMLGNWTLRLDDQVSADIGTLFCATIEIEKLSGPSGQVGYYDMSAGQGASNQVPSIEAAGGTPVLITDPTAAQLSGLDALVVQNPSNGSFGSEYTSRLADIAAAVNGGMSLIFHDRFVTGANSVLPGGGGITTVRDFTYGANIDVAVSSTTVTNGPGGIVGPTTLDGGNSSSHGYVDASTLPAGAITPLVRGDGVGGTVNGPTSADGFPTPKRDVQADNPVTNEGVTTCYPHGAGHVLYSTIPLDFYLSGSNNFSNIYAPNAVAWGMEGCGGGVVGYYDMNSGQGVSSQVPPITTAGGVPVLVTDPTAAQLAPLDVLVVQNPSNSAYGSEYLSRLTDIQNAVNAGMTLVIHDRYVTGAAGILPGGGTISAVRETSIRASNIDVVDTSTVLTNGPGGVIGNTTLDGGNLSSHGYVSKATLPAGEVSPLVRGDGVGGTSPVDGPTSSGEPIHREGGVHSDNPVTDEVVTTCYPQGNGRVMYSTIPLDFYLSGSSHPGFGPIYAPNSVKWGMRLCATGAPASADLAVSQTATPNPASVNTPLQFDVTVDNLGPDGATNVVLTDTLPTNATFNSATPSQGTCGAPVAGIVTCNLGSIASGGQATVAINVTPTSTGTATNTASVTADEADPDTTNNSSTLGVPVYDADLQMTLTDAPDPVLAGTNLTYTMRIDNNGPGTSYNLQAVLTMPAGTTHVGNSGGCVVSAPTVTCTLASLAPGGTWIVTVTVFVPPTTPRFTVLNASATVSALTPDPVPGNNTDDESTLVDTAADLAIIGFAGPSTLPSTGGSYTITGRNFGPSTVPFASIQLNVPAGVTIASASGGTCTMGTGQVTCTTYGSIAPGGTYAMTVAIRAGRGARFTMTARTYSTVPDPNGLNNYASKNVQA